MENQTGRNRRSVGRRLIVLIVFMIALLGSVMMIIGYVRFKALIETYYTRMGETAAGIVGLTIDADSLDTYFETLTPDKKYDETLQILRKARIMCDAQTLYVFKTAENGINYIFDTDNQDAEYKIGEFDPYIYEDDDGKLKNLYPEVSERQIRAGGKVDTIIGTTQYGWTITVNQPLYGSDGTCKGYVGIDFDVNRVIAERTTYLWQLAIVIIILTVIFVIIYLYIIQKAIIHPINTMAKAADSFLVNGLKREDTIGESDILSLNINTRDEMQSLAEALKSMVRKINEHLTNLKLATVKSETDVLTLLYNRGAFEQRVSAVQSLRPEKDQINAFMMIDVDYFKAVNDNYGHAAGDTVLSQCAKALRGVLREADIVGRLGGDEFAVFCKGIGSVAIAEDKARKIRDEWLKIIPPGGEKGITASIGISFSPIDGQEYQELFRKADEALYRAKEAGRDRFALSVKA